MVLLYRSLHYTRPIGKDTEPHKLGYKKRREKVLTLRVEFNVTRHNGREVATIVL